MSIRYMSALGAASGIAVMLANGPVIAQPKVSSQKFSGTVEMSSAAERPVLFVSVDKTGDSLPDVGFLIELSPGTKAPTAFKERANIEWTEGESLQIEFTSGKTSDRRIVFSAQAKQSQISSTATSNRTSHIAIVALSRFGFITGKRSHAELAPRILKRPVSGRIKQR